MKCPNHMKCQTELTQMTNEAGEPTCMRCLKCHPMPSGKPVVKAKKDNVKVDEPWTDARILKLVRPLIEEICQDLIQEFYIPKTESVDSAETIVIDQEKTWREQAKDLSIDVYDKELKRPRLKTDVLLDIANKLNKEPPVVGGSDTSPVEQGNMVVSNDGLI